MPGNYEELSKSIIDAVGGDGNIAVASHCYTRLRLTLRDTSAVAEEALRTIPGVLGVVVRGNDYQIVIGPDVGNMYNVFVKQGSFGTAGEVPDDSEQTAPDKKRGKGKRRGVFTWILDFIAGTFSPCIPILIAGGLTGAVLTVLTNFFGVTSESGTYTVFSAIQNAAFYFLPIFVGFSAAKKLNVNSWLGAFLGAVLLHTSIDGAEGLTFIGIPVRSVVYNTTVFPIMLGVLFMAAVYKGTNRILPKAIKSIFLPLITMIITVPVTLIVLGPIGGIIGGWLSTGLNWLYANAGPVAVMIIGAATPFLVFFGMNNALYPLLFALFADLGFDPLICTGMLAANVAIGAACLAAAIRTRQSNVRGVSVSGGITGLLGITEPAVYGVLFPLRRPLWAAVIGGGVGGLLAGLLKLAAFAIASPSFASLVIFIPSGGSGIGMMNFYNAIIVAVVSAVITFVMGLVLGVGRSDEKVAEAIPATD